MAARVLEWTGPEGGTIAAGFDDGHFGPEQMMVEIALADEAHPNLPDEVPPWSSSVIAKEGTWHLAARFRAGNTVYRGGEQRDLRRLWLTVGLGVSFLLFGFLVMRKVFPDSKVRVWTMLNTAPSVPGIDVDALLERRPDALVLDVREPEEYARHGHVPGAINVPQANLACRPDELPGDRPLLTLCRGGPLASSGAVPQAGGLRRGGERQGRHGGLARGGQPPRL